MQAEIVCSIVAAAGAVASAIIAWLVSRSTASKEIERMKLTWEREDIVSSDDEFAETSAAVAKFINTDHPIPQGTAVEKVAAVRSKEAGAIAQCLDDLYFAVRSGNVENADSCLTQVIQEKRKAKPSANRTNRDKENK